MRLLVHIFSLLCIFSCQHARTKQVVQTFPLSDIRLLDGPFKHAQDLDLQYLLELEADRLLAPFLREAELSPKADSYPNWENSGLDGHIGGHYLSALSLMFASTGDVRIKERLDYMLDELKRCQDATGTGYIGGVPGSKELWNEIAKGDIRAGGFDLNSRWVPLYNIHKTFAGLRDAWLHAGSEQAKEMLIGMADWAIDLTANLTDGQMQDMLRSEHGGLNEIFADVAAITGNNQYLAMARRFSHKYLLDPLLNHEDKLTGMHANTQIPKVLGFKRIADVEGDESWSDASAFFWETVAGNRSVCIGGNSVSEHFNPVDDFSGMAKTIEGPETCNTYNMLRLSKMLYSTSLDKKYIDYYERALYNHILSTQNPRTGGFVYFTQMRPGHYRVYSQPETSFWCCVGSGLENHARYGEMIYAHNENDLYVNLFIPSKLNWEQKNAEVIQETSFPDEEETRLTVNTAKTTAFTLNLRRPAWVQNGELSVTVNGEHYAIEDEQNDYIAIHRKWKKGDYVTMKMSMSIRPEQLPDKSNYYAIFYGPVVLAAKTGTDDMTGLFADDSRGGHIAHGKQVPLREMPILVSNPEQIPENITPVEGKPLSFMIKNLYSAQYPSELELIPFFRLHESRYIIYWAQATAEDVKELQKQIEQEEQEQIRLDNITTDKVSCGEQQPESDHSVKSENSSTGFSADVHWREAKGWFSYQMKNPGKEKVKYLFIKYLNSSRTRHFDITVNERPLASPALTGGKDDEVITEIYPLPANEQEKELLEVKFSAPPGSVTARIIEVRTVVDE